MYRSTRKTSHTGNRRIFTPEGGMLDLLDIKKVCYDLDITFFLEYGTLLGAVREHDFVEAISDIDIGTFNCPKRELILDRLDELGFYERTTNPHERADPNFLGNDHYNICVNRNVIIDFRIYRLGNKPFDDYYFSSYGFYSWPKKYAELMEIDFKGHSFLIQKDYEGFLSWNFGKDWRTPKATPSAAAYRKVLNNEWRVESMKIANEWYENYKKRE